MSVIGMIVLKAQDSIQRREDGRPDTLFIGEHALNRLMEECHPLFVATVKGTAFEHVDASFNGMKVIEVKSPGDYIGVGYSGRKDRVQRREEPENG